MERLDNDAAIERALDALRAESVDAGEVYLRDSTSGSVEVKDGAIENVLSHGERGIGVRVLDHRRAGFAYTSDLSRGGIDGCVVAAKQMSAVTEPDDDLRIQDEPLPPSDDDALGIHEPGLLERAFDERAALALEIERVARAHDPRVTGFRKTTYGDGETTTIIATTGGTRGSYRETHFGIGTSCIATAGDERQIGYDGDAARAFAGVSAEKVGRTAAQQAVDKLGARQMGTQRLPVVLDPRMGAALLGAIAPLLSADNVLKGKSLFAGKVGRRVASAAVTIVDEARIPGGMRTAPFDGEGVPTRDRVLVERGTLLGYLTSLKTARKLGSEPTGNARRGSYAGPSRIAPSNFAIAAGTEDPAAMVGGLERALKVTSLLNLHTVDPVSGEFSLGATGDYLERGDRAYPVQGITIAGNLTALLEAIVGVGRDLTYFPGGIGSPTLVISALSIGGTGS